MRSKQATICEELTAVMAEERGKLAEEERAY
jgi:hypothetical protein